MGDDERTSFVFEDFRLDVDRLMLYRGEKELPLPPKGVETLLALIEGQGTIVGKSDLMSRLWSDTIVEESNLAHYLYLLRKTLGKTAAGRPFIETFRRRGYRFNGEARAVIAGRNGNGAAALLNGSRYGVERLGNVLKVADWREVEPVVGETVPTGIDVRPGRSPLPLVIIAIAAVILGSALYYRNQNLLSGYVPSAASVKGELSITRLTNGGAPQDVTISPDGKYFAYHETDGEVSRMFVQQTGQPNRLEVVPAGLAAIFQKTFSPDGAFVFFLAREETNKPIELYRVPTLGGTMTKVLSGIASPVSFSPDGRQMVFGRYDTQTGESSLIIAAASGSDERVLLVQSSREGMVGNPAWSPDPNLIAYRSISVGTAQRGKVTISGIDLQTGATRSLSPEKWDTCYRMAWASSGLVFVGTREGDSDTTRRDQIFYLAYPSGEARRLTSDGSRHQIGSLGVTVQDEIIAVPNNRSSQIWEMDANGEAAKAVQITNGLADGRAGLSPLADGRIAYITRMGESLNIWLADADGRNQRQLFTEPAFVEELRAASDATYFIFSMVQNGRTHLFRVESDGTGLRQITHGDGSEIDSTISPDGRWIAYDSVRDMSDGSQRRSLWRTSSSGEGEPILVSDQECYAPHYSPDGKMLSCVLGEKDVLIVSAADGTVVRRFEAVKVPTLNSGARWSPGGDAILYAAYQKGVSNIWRQPVSGGPARQFTDFSSGDIYNFAFSQDGARLYVARGQQIRDAVLIRNFR